MFTAGTGVTNSQCVLTSELIIEIRLAEIKRVEGRGPVLESSDRQVKSGHRLVGGAATSQQSAEKSVDGLLGRCRAVL